LFAAYEFKNKFNLKGFDVFRVGQTKKRLLILQQARDNALMQPGTGFVSQWVYLKFNCKRMI